MQGVCIFGACTWECGVCMCVVYMCWVCECMGMFVIVCEYICMSECERCLSESVWM